MKQNAGNIYEKVCAMTWRLQKKLLKYVYVFLLTSLNLYLSDRKLQQ